VTTRTIIGAMGVATIALIAVLAYLAFFADSGGASGPPGSIDTNCQKYRTKNQQDAKLDDPFVKGVVDIGIVEGTKQVEAAALIKSLGTSAFLPFPYRENAFVCTKKGYEEEWVERLRALDWVEWAHVEGVTPIDTLGN
jgi:hypothetical protein